MHEKLTKRVKTLKLFDCDLRKFPEFVLHYQELEVLLLEQNAIRMIPKDIVKLSKLRVLNLNRNSFKEFPVVITALQHLEELYINSTTIPTVGEELLKLNKLQKFTLMNNSFSEIPSVFFKMTQLTFLGIQRLYRLAKTPYKDKTIEDLKAALPDCTIHA